MRRSQWWWYGVVLAASAVLGAAAVGAPSEVWQGATVDPFSLAPPVTEAVTTTEAVPASTTNPSTTAPASTAPTSTTVPSTTTSVPDRSTIRVVVANAAGVGGLAAAGVTFVDDLGYVDAQPSDALERRESTVVVYQPGLQAAAERLAVDLGLSPQAVEPLGTSPIIDDDLEFDLVVLLSTDVEL